MNSQLIAIIISVKKKINFQNKYYDKKNEFFFHFTCKKNVKNTLFIAKKQTKS